jgi:uncharacterized protein YrrD
MKNYLSCLNQRIIFLDKKNKLDFVSDLLFNPDNGKLLGVISQNKNFIPFSFILSWEKNNLKIKSINLIKKLENFKEAKIILEKKTPLIGNLVITNNQEILGKTYDLIFDEKFGVLEDILTEKKFLGIPLKKFKINQKQIIKIKPEKILVKSTILTNSLPET